MDLAHGTGLDRNERGAKIIRDGESGRVDNLDGAARDHVRLLLREMVGVGDVFRDAAAGARDVLCREVAGRRCAGEDVEFLLRGVFERRDVRPEVLGQDGLWDAQKQLAGEKSVLFGEGAGVED